MTLTQKDIDGIEGVVADVVEEKTKNLPTKNEFFTRMDEVMGELEKIRDEQVLRGNRVSSHEDRLLELEAGSLKV